MEREDILFRLKEQYDDELTISIFANYIEDFQKCFSKYISTEEVIKRLKERVVHNIEVLDDYIDGRLDGQYDIKTQKIKLHKSVIQNAQYCSYLAFHELTHAITSKQLPDGRIIMGFSFINNCLGTGINEATTEWLTIIRNDIVGGTGLSGYQTIVEQIDHLARIIGKDKLINCFFYQPERLKTLLTENKIDYSEIEDVFYIFIGKDYDVQNLVNQKKLEKINNYNLYKQSERLLKTYSQAIGTVTSLDDFRKKYHILGKYLNENVNLNKIMEFSYYTQMRYELIQLLNSGITKDTINSTLSALNVPIEKLKLYETFNCILSKDKKQCAIALYNFFDKFQNQYYDFAYQNYGLLFDKFSETNLLPNEEILYDVDKYAMIGKFLSNHSKYEYEEISTQKINISDNADIYYFRTSDGKKYVYTLPEPECSVVSTENNKFRIKTPDSEIVLNLGEKISFELKTNMEKPVSLSSVYLEYSQLEDIEFCMNYDKFNEAERSAYRKRYNNIKARIQDREKCI